MTVTAARPPAPVSPRATAGSDNSARFDVDGDVAGYLGIRVLAALVTVLTLGFGFPFGLVLVRRWKARHTKVGGRRLVFTGSARDLFRRWLAWWPLTVLTLGLYGFAVYPRVLTWMWDHTDYADVWRLEESRPAVAEGPLAPPSRLPLAFEVRPGRHRLSV